MISGLAVVLGWAASVLVPLAVSTKRWTMPATCTSCSPKLEISGVGLYAYFSAGIASATSRISVAARWKLAAVSLARLGGGVCAESKEGRAAATRAKNATHA